MKMLRFSLGVMRMDRIRNEYVRGTAHVGRVGDKVREARLGWFGHVLRRDAGYVGRRMLNMEPPGEEKERETKMEIYGCGEGRYASGWGDGG